jgi:hypothetical protein
LPVRVVALLGILCAVAVFVLVTFIAPDEGPTLISWRQGLALMLVFGAPAVGVLVTPVHAAAVGGAMFVAGAVTMMGGNTTMLLMAACGFLLLLAASVQDAPVTPAVLIRFVVLAIALAAGVYLAHDTGLITGLIAAIIAMLIVISGKFRLSNKRSSRSQLV